MLHDMIRTKFVKKCLKGKPILNGSLQNRLTSKPILNGSGQNILCGKSSYRKPLLINGKNIIKNESHRNLNPSIQTRTFKLKSTEKIPSYPTELIGLIGGSLMIAVATDAITNSDNKMTPKLLPIWLGMWIKKLGAELSVDKKFSICQYIKQSHLHLTSQSWGLLAWVIEISMTQLTKQPLTNVLGLSGVTLDLTSNLLASYPATILETGLYGNLTLTKATQFTFSIGSLPLLIRNNLAFISIFADFSNDAQTNLLLKSIIGGSAGMWNYLGVASLQYYTINNRLPDISQIRSNPLELTLRGVVVMSVCRFIYSYEVNAMIDIIENKSNSTFIKKKPFSM